MQDKRIIYESMYLKMIENIVKRLKSNEPKEDIIKELEDVLDKFERERLKRLFSRD
jgi:uncharacterized protein Yka (UPF0111/DUF47 family)